MVDRMKADDPERWIERMVVRFQESSNSGSSLTPQAFIDGLRGGDDVAANEELLARLARRIERLGHLEIALTGPREAELAPGIELDDFVILGFLGHGGMGQVFRARQKSVPREVAIKTPLWAGRLDEREKARFRREAEAVAQLRHPSIVPLYQVGEHGGIPYLAMELVHGQTLGQILAQLRGAPVPSTGAILGRSSTSWPRAVAQVGIAILEGAESAHREGILHRDLKPANVVIEPDGRVRIFDFGLAQMSGREPLTGTGEVVGTLDYMAPEVLENPRSASQWSDQYSVGVLLYELATLQRPFGDVAPQVGLARALAGEPPPARTRADVPRELSAIVEKAMARDVRSRYASAAEFAADLCAFLEGREILARPSTVFARLGRRMHRHPAITALGVVLLAAVVVLSAVWSNAAEVQARADRDEALDMFINACFLEHLDYMPNQGRRNTTVYRERAADLLAQAADKAPDRPEIRLHRAVLLSELGHKDKARAMLPGLAELGREHRVVDWLRSHIDEPQKAGQTATKIVPLRGEASLDLDELSPIDRVYLARSMGPRDDKLPEVTRSLTTHPLYGPIALYEEATSYSLGQVQSPLYAAGCYRGVLALTGDHPTVAGNLGVILRNAISDTEEGPLRDGLVEDAIESLGRACSEIRDSEFLWNSYAEVLIAAGRFSMARESLEEAIVSLPNNFVLLGTLADAYLREAGLKLSQTPAEPGAQELLEESHALLERAIALNPKYQPNLVRMVDVGYLSDNYEEARRWAEQALALGEGVDADKVRRLIRYMDQDE